MVYNGKREQIIKFGIIDKYILIPIIGGLIKIFYRYLILHIGPSFGNHPFVFSLYSSLGMSLAFIRFIKEPNLDELMPPDAKEKKQIVKRGKFIFICVAILLDFIQTLLATFFYLKTKLNLWNFDIIILGIFSRLILKISLYRHQLLSIASIFILSLIINLIILKEEKDLYINILTFVNQIIFHLEVVIHKLIIENYFSTPSEICFYEGVVNLFLYILCLSIFSNIEVPKEYSYIFNDNLLDFNDKKYLDNFTSYYGKIDIKEIFIVLGYLPLIAMFNLSILITIKKYTPFHILIIFIVGDFEKIIYEYDDWKTYIILIILCIIFLTILIFNEIIELNFCDLSYNIKRNLDIRFKQELLDINDNDSDSDDNENLDINNDNDNKVSSEKKIKLNKNNELNNL